MKIRTIAKALLPLLILSIGIAGFTYLRDTKPKPPKPQPQEKTWQVETMRVDLAVRTPSLTLHGVVESPTQLRAAAPGASWVAELPIREGQQVAAGALLAALDPRDFTPAAAQVRAELAELAAQRELERLRGIEDRAALKVEQELLDLAGNRAERAERLQKQSLGAVTALDDARAALARQRLAVGARSLAVGGHPSRMRQLDARLARLQAQLEVAELAVARSRVTAPFDGIVSRVAVSAGDRVQPGQLLIELYPLDGLEVRSRLPARYVSEVGDMIADGSAAAAGITTPDGKLALRLSRLAGAADPSGVDLLFSITGNTTLLRPGTLLEIRLERPQQGQAIAVPHRAVYGDRRIYLLRDGRLHGIDVDVLGEQRDRDGQSVLLVRSSQIDESDVIVTTQLPNAVSGLKVRTAAP